MSVSGNRVVPFGAVILLLGALFTTLLPTQNAYAAQITSRTLTLEAGTSDGGSAPGGNVNHKFTFTVPTSASVGSIKFEYCTTSQGTCTLPTGMDSTTATMGTQNGATSFTLNNTTNGAPYITRSAASITGGTALTYELLGVKNPTPTNYTFFVRISTFGSTDTSGSAIDTGTVTASTATAIVLTGVMPESLIFCTGAVITSTSGVPDCSTATPGAVSFNQLFSPSDTATATSMMAASTNAPTGYSITVNGTTLTSGSNTIAAMASATTGVRGTSQFGMNLKANTTPAVGAEVAPASNGTNLKGQAATGYDTVNNFKFVSGESIANSSNGGAGGTNTQAYTVSYMTNVEGAQPAGVYTTTLTYICSATF